MNLGKPLLEIYIYLSYNIMRTKIFIYKKGVTIMIVEIYNPDDELNDDVNNLLKDYSEEIVCQNIAAGIDGDNLLRIFVDDILITGLYAYIGDKIYNELEQILRKAYKKLKDVYINKMKITGENQIIESISEKKSHTNGEDEN